MLTTQDVALQIDNIRRKHSNQLSFIPVGTIESRYLVKHRCCLQFRDGVLVGYLLHGVMKPSRHVVLTQVAVEGGSGLYLYRKFERKARLSGCSGIRIRCAEDVKVNWSFLGFNIIEVLDVQNCRQRKINIWYKSF